MHENEAGTPPLLLNFLFHNFAIMFDAINRIFLSPNDLYDKRKATQSNELKRAFEDVSSASQRFVRSKKNITSETISEGSTSEIDNLVKDILDKDKVTPSILAIKSDGSGDGESTGAKIEVALKSANGDGYDKMVDLPLVQFGLKLADAFENQLTSTTLCFIADASSGLGSEMLGQVIAGCGAGVVSQKSNGLSFEKWRIFGCYNALII